MGKDRVLWVHVCSSHGQLGGPGRLDKTVQVSDAQSHLQAGEGLARQRGGEACFGQGKPAKGAWQEPRVHGGCGEPELDRQGRPWRPASVSAKEPWKALEVSASCMSAHLCRAVTSSGGR